MQKNKIMRSVFFILFLTIVFSLESYCQLTISGEIRPRFEHRYGYKKLPDSASVAANFMSQRTRINLDYKTKNLKTFISVQDVRVWGDEKFKADNPGIALAEGWAEIALNKKISLKAGRQFLSYDNQRIIAKSDWGQGGIFHDALMLKFQDSLFELHAVSAFNQTGENVFGMNYSTYSTNYISLNILWAKYQIKNFSIATLQVADGYQKAGTENTFYFRYTPGLIFSLETKKLSAGIRYFHQLGKSQTGLDIDAFYSGIDLSYKINDKFKLGIGNEFMSGNDFTKVDDKKLRAFDVLYGTRHSYNGNMDYYGGVSDTKSTGLDDTYFKFKYNINKNINVNIDYHYFMISGKYVYKNEEISKELGSELDLIVNAKISDVSSLQFGYSTMFATKSAEILKGGDKSIINRYAYVMITIKPVFFKDKTN